jgi:hypothetical protein
VPGAISAKSNLSTLRAAAFVDVAGRARNHGVSWMDLGEIERVRKLLS